jgi:hypoxanthine phosphoribosyltransferase
MNISQLMEQINETIKYLEYKIPQTNQFKLQEIDHPLILSLAAYQTARNFPSVDHLLCLPSGGTQFGIATELMYEYMSKVYGTEFIPKLSSLVLSTHAGRRGNGTLLGREDVVTRLRELSVSGKDVLLLDDNSNTGLTLQIAKDALSEVGVHSVHVSLAELDPLRILYKQTDIDPPEEVANLLHPDFDSVASIVPIVVYDGSRDIQLRKLIAGSIVKGM